MASGSVVIADEGDQVNVSLSFDPPIEGDSVPTPAQRIALELFGRLVEQMKNDLEMGTASAPEAGRGKEA